MLPKRWCRVLALLALITLAGRPAFALPAWAAGPVESRRESTARAAVERFVAFLGEALSGLVAAESAPPPPAASGGQTAESGITIDPDGTPAAPSH